MPSKVIKEALENAKERRILSEEDVQQPGIEKEQSDSPDVRELIKNREPRKEYYTGALSGLEIPKSIKEGLSQNLRFDVSGDQPAKVPDNVLRRNFVREAADNTDVKGIYIDRYGSEREIGDSRFSTISGKLFGYNDIIYISKVGKRPDGQDDYSILDPRAFETTGKDAVTTAIEEYFDKFDPNMEYAVLVPTIHPHTGEPILKEEVGTMKELKEKFNLLPKYGLADKRTNIFSETVKGLLNTLGTTDDLVVGVGDMLVNTPLKWAGLAEDDNWYDEVHQTILEDTDLTGFIPSESSSQFGSLDWFGAGLGNTVGSLLQFGSAGRVTKGVLTGIGAGGRELIGKEVLKRKTVDALSRYGASGFVGFGYGYNEAKQNGLSDSEAFAFGFAVGGINAFIESKLGVSLDRYLVGGGSRGISNALMREISGEVSQESLERGSKSVITNFLSKGIPGALPESAEEMAQTLVEQGGRWAFNTLYSKNNSDRGKFDNDEFNFLEIISGGIFGFFGGLPFSTASGMSGDSGVADFVVDGRANEVKSSLNKLLADGKINKSQFIALNAEVDMLNEIYVENSVALDNIKGKYKDRLKKSLFMLHRMKKALVIRKETLSSQSDVLDDTKPQKERVDGAKDTKKAIEAIDIELGKINEEIQKYNDPKFIGEQVKAFDAAVKSEVENADNVFAKLAEVEQPLSSAKEIFDRYKSLTKDERSENQIIRNVDEAIAVLDAIRNNSIEFEDRQAAIDVIREDLLETKMYLSPRLVENYRDELIAIGIDENILPLTREERQSADEGKQTFPGRQIASSDLDSLSRDPQVREDMLQSMSESERTAFEELDEDHKTYRTLIHLFQNKEKYGITDAQLFTLDESGSIGEYFDDEHRSVIDKLVEKTNKPITLIFAQGNSGREARGFYQASTGAIVIQGDFSALAALKGRNLNKKEQKEYDRLRRDLFHKIVHEFGHSLWDGYLAELYRGYVSRELSGKNSVEAIVFKRLLDLATLTYEGLKNKADKNSYFFNVVAPNYFAGNSSPLEFVREFFTESISNSSFQSLLDNFDINGRENEELVKRYYNYKRIPGKKNSILAEIQKALLSVFHKLKNIFTKKERTLLQEAFVLASNFQVNKFPRKSAKEIERDLNVDRTIEQSISAYNGVDLFAGLDTPDILNLPSDITDRLISIGVISTAARDKITSSFTSLIENEVLDAVYGDDTAQQTLKVIFFQESPTTLITWKSSDNKTHRVFANPFGDRIYVNTNPFNKEAPMTLSKHNAFAAFSPQSKNDEAQIERREMINNLRKAQLEGFSGEITLDYDDNHSWDLNGRTFYGQVKVMYQFENGSRVPIGYTHDLTKVRISRILQSGARVKMKIDPSRDLEGSHAYIKLDENGDLADVVNGHYTQLSDAEAQQLLESGYRLEKIAPRINLLYDSVESLSNEAIEAANKADSFTTEDESVDVDISQLSEKEIIDREITNEDLENELGIDFSFYDNSENRLVREALDHTIEGFKRRLRYAIASYGLSNVEIREVANAIIHKGALPYLRNRFSDNEEYLSAVQYMGFASMEELKEFISETVDTESKVVGRFPDRHNADWEGHGKNPVNTISSRIKYAVESLVFEVDGKRRFIDFIDARDVLFRSSRATESYEEMLSNIKDISESPDENTKTRAIAESIHKYLSQKVFNESGEYLNREGKFVHEGKNSWWAQFASYKFTDSVTVHAVGDHARVYFNSHTQMIKDQSSEIIGGIVSVVDGIKREAKDTGISPLKLYRDRMNEAYGKPVLRADGNPTLLINLISSDNTHLGVANKPIDKDRFELMAGRVKAYFEFLGIEIPETFLSHEYNSSTDNYVYFTRSVYVKNRYVREKGHYQFIKLLTQLSNFINKQIESDLSGKDPDYNMNELKVLSEKLAVFHTGYKTPEFYFDPNNNKRWSYKLKSFADDLLERLTFNKNGALDRYLKSDMYKHNLVLKKIKNSQGAPIEVSVSGLRGFEGNQNTDYETAVDLDFYYMAIGLFVGLSSESEYLHIDDIPSDKPNILAYRLNKILPSSFESEIQRILDIEKTRLEIANDLFRNAFTKLKGEDVFKIEEQEEFSDLVEGIHYKAAGTRTDSKGNEFPVYKKGSIFDEKNHFYPGKTTIEIINSIDKKIEKDYERMLKKGLVIPVPQIFEQIEKKGRSKKEYEALLEQERRRIFREFSYNFMINRYHTSQLLMGDYVFYKGGSDEFADLNKRKAGPSAPFVRGMWSREKGRLAIIEDIDEGETNIELPKIVFNESTQQWQVEENATPISSNRSDAQGYVTEEFAQEIIQAYGSLANYEKVFKPVMFGVNEDRLNEARPLYLKLSLAVIPNPENPDNQEFYRKYPGNRSFAEKIYQGNADIAVFKSGIKTGISHVNQYTDTEFDVQEFDLKLFGLQNNPVHEMDEDNKISGMVQMNRQIGDNGNFAQAMLAHAIEASLLADKTNLFFSEKLANIETITDLIKDNLSDAEHTKAIADFIDQGVRVLDNPAVSRLAEPILNSTIRAATSLIDRDGEKLVNLSELGLSRPQLTADEQREWERLIARVSPFMPEIGDVYDTRLKWSGPRRLYELNLNQLRSIVLQLENRDVYVDQETGYIYNNDGKIKIFPAEVLVPEDGGVYEIGDRVISVRIPTSAINSIIAGEVVGHLPESMGNVIVVGEEGPGVLGFDFDIDGLFTWRKSGDDKLNQMFDIYFNILTDASNYNEATSPVSTDMLSSLADIFSPIGNSDLDKFSFQRQAELHKLNTIGKRMIGVSAMASGIHSIMSQNPSKSPFIRKDVEVGEAIFTLDHRRYFADGRHHSSFETQYTNRRGEVNNISGVFVQLINAATDNAKLQLLGRLNINLITAPVLMDMISHGIDIEYALYFINQPIIMDYVQAVEASRSATYQGDNEDVFEKIVQSWEERARGVDSEYEYDPTVKGMSTRNDIIYKKGGFFNSIIHFKDDRRNISVERLEQMFHGNREGAFEGNNELEFIDEQIAVLEKFKYYGELARVTSDAGTIVSAVSSFPKSYVELMNTLRRIENAKDKIDIHNVITSDLTNKSRHPIYAHYYETLERLRDKYEEVKLYANKNIQDVHYEIAGSASTRVQNKVMDDFYTYILSESQEPNLTTSSLNGEIIDPYYFVHGSAILIKELKEKFPDNEFLRFLKIKDTKGSRQDVVDKKVMPSIVETNLLYDIEGDLLNDVHAAFKALPESYEYRGYPVNTKDLILAHLLYTKGFGLGGFSYSKILPPEVIKSLDSAINEAADLVQMADELLEEHNNSGDMWLELHEVNAFRDYERQLADGVEVDQEVAGEMEKIRPFVEAGNYFTEEELDIIDRVKFWDFKIQAMLNNQSLIPDIRQSRIDRLENPGSFVTKDGKEFSKNHYDLWKVKGTGKNRRISGASYKGLVRHRVLPDGLVELNISRDQQDKTNQDTINTIISKGVVKMNDKIYRLTDIEVMNPDKPYSPVRTVTLREVQFNEYGNLRQYAKGSFNVIIDRSTRDSDLVPDNNTQALDFKDIQENAVTVEADISAITRGEVTGARVPETFSAKKGDQVAITDRGYLTAVVRLTKDPYTLESAFNQIKANPRYKGREMESLKNRWAEIEGKNSSEWSDEMLNETQIQFDYIAALDPDGGIIHQNKRSGDDISRYENTQEVVASEKTIRDLAARMSDRIGIPVRFESDRTKKYKGKLENNTAIVNLAYATLDTPIHEILGHPIIRAIKNRKTYYKAGETAEFHGYGKPYRVTIEKIYDDTLEADVIDEKGNKQKVDLFELNKTQNTLLYQNLLKELEYGKGKEVFDRIKRDYIFKKDVPYMSILKRDVTLYYDKNTKTGYIHDNNNPSERKTFNSEQEVRDYLNLNDKYTLEEQQEEAIVELLGLYTANKLDEGKDAKLISILKKLLNEIKEFLRDLIKEREVEINKLPNNMTIGDLADLFAYSNSKLILPGYEVEYTTPDNRKFKAYSEASKHISELAKSVEDVDLTKPIEKYAVYFSDMIRESDGGYDEQTRVEYFNSLKEAEEYSKRIPSDLFDKIEKIENFLPKDFIEKNKQYEQSKEIIEEWKKVNNIQYNPEEVYSRGQEFVSVVGAYSDFDVNLMMQNLLQHIEDNQKAGGEFTISAFTKPVDKKIGHLEGGGGKIKFKIYPQSKDIKWAANTDVYSGSVWDASEKVSKDKKSELLGISYTKYPSLQNVSSVQPNLASIVDNLAHHHNELGISLTGSNFRLEYDEDIPYSTKKIIDSINSILDDKYGKLVKPEINMNQQDIERYELVDDYGIDGDTQTLKTFNTLEEAKQAAYELNKKENYLDSEYGIRYSYKKVFKKQGKQPTQTFKTIQENITDVQARVLKKQDYDDGSGSFELNGFIYSYEMDGLSDYLYYKMDSNFKQISISELEFNKAKDDFDKQNSKEYTSQALINSKIAKLKEAAKKYPRSLIRSEVVKSNTLQIKSDGIGNDLPFQLVQDISLYDNSLKTHVKESLIKKLKAGDIRDYDVRKSDGRGFFRSLKKFGITPVEISVLKNHIYSKGITSATKDELISSLDSGDNDISFYNNNYIELTPDQKFERILDITFNGAFKNLEDLEPMMDEPVPLPYTLINPETGEHYTYWDYLNRLYMKYEAEEQYLIDLYDKIENENFLGIDENGNFVTSSAELDEIWKKLKTEFTTLNGLAESNFGKVYNLIADELASRMASAQMELWSDKGVNMNTMPGQEDIKSWEARFTLSPFDFTERQLVMQSIGRQLQAAAGRSDRERDITEKQLEGYVNRVRELYYKKNPMSFRRKVNLFASRGKANDPLLWMFEKVNGKYTGKFIQRYAEDEDVVRERIYAKNDEGYYIIKNNQLIGRLIRSGYTNTLLRSEINEIQSIMQRYGLSATGGVRYSELPENLQSTYRKDMNRLRKLTVKATVRQHDSDFFKQLKDTIKREPNTINGQLAKAQIDLYDYIYFRSEKLMTENGIDGYNISRAFMPQSSMDVYEEYSRNGLLSAYLKFMGVDRYNEAFQKIQVSFAGQTKTVEEWIEYYMDKNRSIKEKIFDAPADLKKIINIARNHAAKGTGGIYSEYTQSVLSNFQSSSTVPFKTIAEKKDFSINAARIVNNHFNNLIFKKHHDHLIPRMQAAELHYKQMGGDDKEAYKNIINFINWYSDRYFFGQRDELSNSLLGKIAERATVATVLRFLGLNPITSGYNLAVGLSGELLGKIGEYGYREGVAKMGLGIKRLTGRSASGVNSLMTRVKEGKIVFSPKAIAILNRHNIETFSNIDIEKHHDWFQKAQEVLMFMQVNTELFIRGSSFLAELTDEEWDNYYLDNQGVLQARDPSKVPSINKVKEFDYYINKRQGDYSTVGRRNYHGLMFARLAMLFKGWLIDFMNFRFASKRIDQYGKETEGYYTTLFNMIKNYKQTIEVMKDPNKKFSKMEAGNLKRIVIDLSMMSALFLAMAPLDEEDKEEAYWREALAKLHGQLFLQFHPQDWIDMVVQPFPSMYMIENIANALDGLIRVNAEQTGTSLYNMVPGKKIIEMTTDAINEE